MPDGPLPPRRVRPSPRRWLLVGGLIAAIGAATVAVVVHTGSRREPATPHVATTPHGQVPWLALAMQQYLPAVEPTPSPAPAPLCRTSDLAELPPTTAAATGNEAVVFRFTNRSAQPCRTGGYPRVVLSQPGLRTVVPASGGFWDEGISPEDLAPHATATFFVGFELSCGNDSASDVYRHVTVTLPGGGTLVQTLTGTAGYNGVSPLGVYPQCGTTVSRLAGPAGPTVYAPDPLAVLVPSLAVPASTRAGAAAITYAVTLSNPSAAAVDLSPCRDYLQTLDHEKGPGFGYELNCAAAHPIAAGQSESFTIEIPSAGISPGAHTLCWSLDEAVATHDTCTTVRVTA